MASVSPFVAGKLAVVTGAASGVGRACARRAAAVGMKVVLLDNDPDPARLESAVAECKTKGAAEVVSKRVDVTDAAALAAVVAEVGPPYLLHANAGVSRKGGSAVGGTAEAFAGTMSVNFFGVVSTVQAFLPGMLDSGEAGVVVITGSKQGITKPPGNVAYNCSKAALNAFAEGLQHELRSREGGCRVTAHLLVPGWTNTDILVNCERASAPDYDPSTAFFSEAKPKTGAWMPDQVVEFLEEELAKGRFYVLCPDNEVSRATDNLRMTWAMQDLTQDRPPLSRWHPDYKAPFEQFVKDNA